MNDFSVARLLDIMPLHVYWKDAHGVYLGCNLAQAHGFELATSEDVIRKTDLQLTSDLRSAKTWMKNDQKVMRHGIPMVFEETYRVHGQKKMALS